MQVAVKQATPARDGDWLSVFKIRKRTNGKKPRATRAVIIANIINLWNSFGRPVSVKNL